MAIKHLTVTIANSGELAKPAARALAQMVLEFYSNPENRRAYDEECKAAETAAAAAPCAEAS